MTRSAISFSDLLGNRDPSFLADLLLYAIAQRMIETHHSFEIVYIRDFYHLSKHNYRFPYEKVRRQENEKVEDKGEGG